MNKALHHSITCMFLIIVFFAGAYKLQSQNIGRFELPHYDQLPNRQIKKIFQDSEGLIWYCTEDGLCRDDGYNIQIFRSDFKTPDVIKHNHISQKTFPEKSGSALCAELIFWTKTTTASRP